METIGTCNSELRASWIAAPETPAALQRPPAESALLPNQAPSPQRRAGDPCTRLALVRRQVLGEEGGPGVPPTLPACPCILILQTLSTLEHAGKRVCV